MTQIARTMRVDAGATPGEFEMILATEGEASDGHILNIRGGFVPSQLPLLNSHFNSPTDALGSIIAPRKDLDASPPVLRATGKIEMGGEGASADIRRDLAHMIERGHIGAVSIRWDGIKGTPRVELPDGHAFRVEKGATGAARNGTYFEEWRALEGSVVAIGADSGALIQHADQCEDPTQREFWRSMAADAETETVVAVADSLDDLILEEILNRLDSIDDALVAMSQQREDVPVADQQPEPQADQPARVADQRPTESQRIPLDDFRTLLSESREADAESRKRMLDDARGRVS